MNQLSLDKIKNQDYKKIQKEIESFIKDEIKNTHTKGIVFGLSGGIDSALVAALSVNVLKKNVLGLIMPESKSSPKNDIDDAVRLAKKLKIKYKIIKIDKIESEVIKQISSKNKLAQANLKARIRANIIYYYANLKNYLVLGTSDKSEYMIGYFTKFGDGSCDIMPIVSLYKTQVRELSTILDIPKSIISKKSGAHLWKNHYAETELGLSYEEIDSILYHFIEEEESLNEIIKITGIKKNKVGKILYLYKNSQHKRESPKNMLKNN